MAARILVFAGLATLLDGVDLAIILYFLKAIADHFHVGLGTVSAIVMASQIAGIVGAIAFGHVADRFGRRPALAASVFVFSLFTMLSGLAESLPTFVAARLLAGFGLGGEAGIAFALVNETFAGRQARRGLLSALLQAMIMVGGVAAAMLYSWSHAAVGPDAWRLVFAWLGAGMAFAVAIHALMPESPAWLARASTPGRAPRAPLAAMLRGDLGRTVLVCTAMLTCGWTALAVPATYAPTVWQTVYRMPPAQVGLVGAISGTMLGVGYIVAGALSDRHGRRSAFRVGALICGATFALFMAVAIGPIGAHTGLLIAAYCLASGSGAFFGIQGAWVSELLPLDIRASAFNLIYYVSRCIGAGFLPLAAFGLVGQLGLGLQYVLGFGAIGAIGAFAFSLMLPETRT